MVEHVYYYVSDSVNPYHNLALQSYIFNNIPDNSMVFLLWQNNDTVLLGNNQNPYHECNLAELELDRCHLARRDSNGKAIFNDLGCLNYGFFLYQNNYNIVGQINVIYQALRKLNLPIYLDSDNEILLNSRYLVENAYLTKQERCMQTGTIYWDVEKNKRLRILKEGGNRNIINVSEYNPCINLEDIKRNVLQSLADKFGPAYQLSITDDLEDLVEFYNSYKHVYNTAKPYTIIINENYDFGNTQFYIDMIRNRINKIDVYMQNEDYEVIESIHHSFDNLIIDDVTFKKRMFDIDDKYKYDFENIYRRIKKEAYHI